MKEPLRVFIIGVHSSEEWELLSTNGVLPWGHRRSQGLEKADAAFLWLGDGRVRANDAFLVGVATELHILLYAGAKNSETISAGIKDLDWGLFHRPTSTGTDVRDAYERVMADVDINPAAVHYDLTTAVAHSICEACGSSISPGNPIRSSRHYGKQHVDCYESRKNPHKADAAIFHAGLIAVLREDNARLEAEIRELRGGVTAAP